MRRFILLLLAVVFPWHLSWAETPSKNTKDKPASEAPPPPPENYAAPATEPAGGEPEPEVTITTKGTDKHEEYRINGRLYMVKVTPAKGKPYYLIDNEGRGQLRRSDFQPTISVPTWVIKRF